MTTEDGRIGREHRLEARFKEFEDRLEARFSSLEHRIDDKFNLTIGITVTLWVIYIVAIVVTRLV